VFSRSVAQFSQKKEMYDETVVVEGHVPYFHSKTNQMHNLRVYWISVYMFRTVFPSIIRSSRLYTQHQVYVMQVSWVLASKQSTNLHDIYLMLCIQSWTPDDGRKDRPKHVDWYSVNPRIVHQVLNTTWCLILGIEYGLLESDAILLGDFYLLFEGT
jgi:hypothetical protein